MRVAIAEDEKIYRTGLVELLTAAGVTVTCQAATTWELLDYLSRDQPDAILLDINFKGPPDEGLVTAEEVSRKYPKIAILILSTHIHQEYVRRFFANGTSGRGYLLKERFNNIEDVRHALDLVHRGKTYSDTPVLDILHQRQLSLTEVLTPLEVNILRLLATGLTNAAIAAELQINEDKVENAAKSIYLKIGHHPDRNPRVYAAFRWLQEMPPGPGGTRGG